MYKIYFINFIRYAEPSFGTLAEAIVAARGYGFQSVIYDNGNPVKYFCPINGLRNV